MREAECSIESDRRDWVDSSPEDASTRSMNRHQLNAAEMDRRHAHTVRWLSLLGAALVVSLALWGARVPISLRFKAAGDTGGRLNANHDTRLPIAEGATAAASTSVQFDHARSYSAEADPTSLSRYSDGAVAHVPTVPPNPLALVLTEDPLTDVIRSMPLYEGEIMVGLKVFPGQKKDIFDRLGLRLGDVITEIDGSVIADRELATRMLRTLTEGAILNVEVTRDAGTISMRLNGAIIVEAAAAQRLQTGEATHH